ncbi:MAG: PilZ domain-containing protein [Clostridiaceae bacterium]|nr:PilZ domain-containing protein [Clostridiaceae bacterium]
MFIKSGDVISLRHYSNSFETKGIVLDVIRELSDDILSVKIGKNLTCVKFLEDDPVVLGLERGGNIYISSCYVVCIVVHEGIIKLALNNEEFIVNNRAHERFPVSIHANIRNKISNEGYVAVIKNISYNGLMICSKKEEVEGNTLDVRFYFNSSEIYLGAKIMWKMKRSTDYEYGLKIIYMEYNCQSLLGNFIEKLKQEQEDFIRNLIEE